ncbi:MULTISPECIES: HypC/HybG/HupF family hydrogenase formation chaperone [unclassified Mesorhizobium]|uniref:HypC/HybG/HupF family hydrogenase formation chaperone n=1 Tax=unclassified Mesorhizobium TaxID=325217 RepID=UPI000F753DB4|nr:MULTISPECIES: HypC/HybG/HupF family hydrogenase formation chaperone [unclassified Mesorhizobium]AZO25512.1 HypC/HybG/HupF family hydrogenase formation chaperone [Mesorhizobium sp. M1E.F.Ca.ET.045.02.1.1]RUW30263.1 HypC/HybG/HupF family hydrogenase formation chaperone [Mesorhizobium sp. M1E.F.Ca.ET.041.01.1.1]RWD90880.1 MAG: HypC/HybG/HupF family hydrogenase formation chaperone [Mesorhizobium sp.]RWD92169.1 MAG: HypC/HybG/HupF family hydrogenase formation chaperone [Mesorhizobium sp.]TIU2586
MCLAIPARVVELLDNDVAVVAFDTVRKRISLALVEDVAIGDFVLVHVGYALHKVSVEEAERTLGMMAEAGVLREELEEISA